MFSPHSFLALAAFSLLAASPLAAQSAATPPLSCPTSTGREATLVLNLPEGISLPPEGGWLIASTPSTPCVGQAVWHPELRTLTLHGDDPLTPGADGAQPGETLELRFYDAAGRPVALQITPVLDGTACTSCNADFVYEHDGLYVVSEVEISTPTDAGAGLAITQPAVKSPYPNPARGAATLEIALPAAEPVRVTLFDVLGREVRRLSERPLPAGMSRLQVDTQGLASGSYLLRVEGESFADTRALVVIE